ncbi:MAG: cell envelope biogenesis protein OmpA [Oceanihabitans sp.]
MNTAIKKLIAIPILVCCFLFATTANSQVEEATWKAQFAFGINSPSQNGFVKPFKAKSINFPSFSLGVQYTFKPKMAAKLDFGYNRIGHASNSPEFKVNYSRINAQFVYNITSLLALPPEFGLQAHAGPGFTFVKPLGDFTNNNTNFFNLLAGVEFHYGFSRTLSAFIDASYIYGLSSNYKKPSDGFGSFNGNLLTLSAGVSIALSDCYFCE